MRFYTQNGWGGAKYDINLSIKDIARLVRQDLKRACPGCKFSVRTKTYSGGQSLYVSLMSAPWPAFKNPPKEPCLQINEKHIQKDYKDTRGICNGETLTKQAWETMQKAISIVNNYNYSDCDASIDFFRVNFYTTFEIGQWSRPYQIKK